MTDGRSISLKTEIALLKNGRNSKTGSTPPSHDIGRSNAISFRGKSGKKPGGQSGHTGHTLVMREQADEIIEHSPRFCKGCGESPDAVGGKITNRRQEVEIPVVKARYIEHRSLVKTCPCCGLANEGAFPLHVKAPVQYGSSVKSLVGYLSVYLKVKTKVSGQFRNPKGAERFAKLRSVIDTTVKNGQDVFTALQSLAVC